MSSDTDGGINQTEYELDYENDQNHLTKESIEYISTVLESLYEYEKSEKTNHEFRNSLYMVELYKYFISGKLNDKVVQDIINSLDFNLVKKFDASKDIYKDILIKHAMGA